MAMLYPMFSMVVLTFVVGISLGVSRFLSVKQGQVRGGYYKLFIGDGPPEHIIKLGRNFSNLLEVPMLFYVLGVLVIALNVTSTHILTLAWVYVALRIAHSFIHITYNNPLHRFLTFLLSSLLVLVMWILLMLSVLA